MKTGTKKFLGVALLGLGAVGAYLYYKGKQAASSLKGCAGCGPVGAMDSLNEAQKWINEQRYPTQEYNIVERVDQATGLAGLAAMDMNEVFNRQDNVTRVEFVPAHGIGVAKVAAFRKKAVAQERHMKKLGKKQPSIPTYYGV